MGMRNNEARRCSTCIAFSVQRRQYGKTAASSAAAVTVNASSETPGHAQRNHSLMRLVRFAIGGATPAAAAVVAAICSFDRCWLQESRQNGRRSRSRAGSRLLRRCRGGRSSRWRGDGGRARGSAGGRRSRLRRAGGRRRSKAVGGVASAPCLCSNTPFLVREPRQLAPLPAASSSLCVQPADCNAQPSFPGRPRGSAVEPFPECCRWHKAETPRRCESASPHSSQRIHSKVCTVWKLSTQFGNSAPSLEIQHPVWKLSTQFGNSAPSWET